MEKQKKRPEQSSSSGRRSLKRKLEEDLEDDRDVFSLTCDQDLLLEIGAQVQILDNSFSSIEADRASAKRAIHVISEFAKTGSFYSSFFEFYFVPYILFVMFRVF